MSGESDDTGDVERWSGCTRKGYTGDKPHKLSSERLRGRRGKWSRGGRHLMKGVDEFEQVFFQIRHPGWRATASTGE
jgi:hypothetical protein